MKRKKYNSCRYMELETKFAFGKYWKVKLLEVIEKDNNYVNWCIEQGIIRLSARAEYYRNNGVVR